MKEVGDRRASAVGVLATAVLIAHTVSTGVFFVVMADVSKDDGGMRALARLAAESVCGRIMPAGNRAWPALHKADSAP